MLKPLLLIMYRNLKRLANNYCNKTVYPLSHGYRSEIDSVQEFNAKHDFDDAEPVFDKVLPKCDRTFTAGVIKVVSPDAPEVRRHHC